MPRWNPWQALRGRDHITFALDNIARYGGGGLYAQRGERAVIVIDPSLSRRERNAALAHELIHDEWGPPADHIDSPAAWDAVVSREEERVNDEVARRLIPLDDLRRFLVARVAVLGGVTAQEVADEYDVPLAVAERALRRAG